MRNLFHLILLLSLSLSLTAQEASMTSNSTFSPFWEGGLFLGGSTMGGDLVVPRTGSLKNAHFAYGIMLRRYFNPNFALRTNLLHTRLSGNDARHDYPRRNYVFETPLTELSIDFEWDILGHRKFNGTSQYGGVSPYLLAGLGLAFTDPEVNLGDASRVRETDFSHTRFAVPVGVGVRINLPKDWALALELSVRPTFSDYVDGISENGNPNKDDWYGFISTQAFKQFGQAPTGPPTAVTPPPPDTDGDGIPNIFDACAMIAGIGEFGGCPDGDGDGIRDKDDGCPEVYGLKEFGGCPDRDTDGDNISDKDDKCPIIPGKSEYAGCFDCMGMQPLLNYYTESLSFKAGSDSLDANAMQILDKVAEVLTDFPACNLKIEGHTDNQGEPEYNQALSEDRARSCYRYLRDKRMVPSVRMVPLGLGQERPRANNDTEEGRLKNRRVEFNADLDADLK